ncbi:MAG: glycosyltransferase [Planctomycetes bacterium]|nr:glycosyltransferase [Planctomycetota bacterium]
MHVVHLNLDPGVGPTKKKGASVHVACMRRAFERVGATVHALDRDDCGASAFEELEALHARHGLELVYERYALGADVGARFARVHGVPLVLEVNAPLLFEAAEHRARPVGPSDHARERAIFASAERLLCVSGAVAEYAARHGLERSRLLVRPNGVDVELFRPRDDSDLLRRALGLEGRFVIGFHGRLRPWHGFELVVDAARRLLARGIDVHVLAVGEGAFDEALAPLGPKHATHVEWVAHEDVARYVACFDALALGYRAEAACYFSPLKLFEALAAGVSVVVPSAGDLVGTLRDGEHALFYPPGDATALATALARVARDDELRLHLARSGRELAAAHSWEAIAREVLGFRTAERTR